MKRRGLSLFTLGNCVMIFAGIFLMALSFFMFQWSIIEKQREQMMVIAKSISKSIDNYIDGCYTNMELLCNQPDFAASVENYLSHGETESLKQVLEAAIWETPALAADICLTDQSGRPVVDFISGGAYSLINEASVQEGKLAVYSGSENMLFLGLSLKISDNASLLFLIDMNELYDSTAAFASLGDKGYVMIKTSDGLIIMHPLEEQLGEDVLDGRRELYPDLDYSDLENLVARQKTGADGIDTYYSYWWADESPRRIRKISAYTSVSVAEDFLIVSAVNDYSELVRPIWHIAFMMILAAALITFGIMWLLRRLYSDYKKVEQENQYLRKLNSSLEEMTRRQEKLQHDQRLQMIGTLVSGITHEFSNLLTPIMGLSEMLLDDLSETDPTREDIEAIYNSSCKAKEIIQQITSLGRKNLDLAFRAISLDETVLRTLKIATASLPEGVELITEVDFEGNCILGSSTQISQVILNLCTNAIHAMKDGAGQLRVLGSIEEENAAKYAVLRFCDNGIGMDAATLKQIFDPFFTTKHADKGTGLGLSIVQNIIELHHGRITVESELGVGTTFTLRLPIVLTDKTEKREKPQPISDRGGAPLPEIAVVEDDTGVLNALVKGLSKRGFTVRAFSNPADALQSLESAPCGLIITDYSMPQMTGIEFAMRIKGGAGNTKILLLTGFADADILDYIRRGIIDAFLTKPASIDEVLLKLQAFAD